jgi:hypothetical protein
MKSGIRKKCVLFMGLSIITLFGCLWLWDKLEVRELALCLCGAFYFFTLADNYWLQSLIEDYFIDLRVKVQTLDNKVKRMDKLYTEILESHDEELEKIIAFLQVENIENG